MRHFGGHHRCPGKFGLLFVIIKREWLFSEDEDIESDCRAVLFSGASTPEDTRLSELFWDEQGLRWLYYRQRKPCYRVNIKQCVFCVDGFRHCITTSCCHNDRDR